MLVVKNPPANVGNARDLGLIPRLGRSHGEENGNSWTEEPGGLQSIGSQRVGHNWMPMHVHACPCVCRCAHTHTYTHTHTIWFCPCFCKTTYNSGNILRDKGYKGVFFVLTGCFCILEWDWLVGKPAMCLVDWTFQSQAFRGVEVKSVINNLINHAYVRKSPWKPIRMGFWKFPGWRTRMLPCQPGPQIREDRSSYVQDLALYISSSGCWCAPFNMLCNTLIIQWINGFSEFCEPLFKLINTKRKSWELLI